MHASVEIVESPVLSRLHARVLEDASNAMNPEEAPAEAFALSGFTNRSASRQPMFSVPAEA